MKKVTADAFPVYATTEEDAKKFIQWAYQMHKKTQFNPAILRNPRACMVRAQYDGETGLMVPLQPVLWFDALTPDPQLSNAQRAIGMKRISDFVEHQVMPQTGMHDAFFTTNDDAEAELALRHGWTEVKGVRLMRKRIEAETPSVVKEPTDA